MTNPCLITLKYYLKSTAIVVAVQRRKFIRRLIRSLSHFRRLNWKHIFSLPVSRVVSRYIIGNEVTSKMPRAAAPDTFSLRRDSKLLRIEFRRKIDSNGERERRAFSKVGCDRSVHLQDQSFFTGLVGANEFTGTALQIRRFAFVHLCGEPASRSTSLSIINPRARAEEGTRRGKAKEDIDRETR